ncbi:MAG: hypothetical protein JXA95_08550 [Spirochaetales bacterium]|nr:hypothetical protein [Spirochaetales bacterium]
MRKILYLLAFLLFCSFLYGREWSIQTGLGYEFFGFRAEEGTIELDSHYHQLGLDLGLATPLSDHWEIRSNLFIGFPLSGAVYINGELNNNPELSLYTQYRYYSTFAVTPAYRLSYDSFSLSLGPSLIFDNLVLASYTSEPGYVLSYSAGLGVSGHFEYYIRKWILYADLAGNLNPLEWLVVHDDFSYAYGMGFSLGAVWKL